MTPLNFDTRYAADTMPGVAFYLLGYVEEPNEDTEWSGVPDTDYTRVVAVMIGDDRKYLVDVDSLRPLADGDYCSVCGQIGCPHGG